MGGGGALAPSEPQACGRNTRERWDQDPLDPPQTPVRDEACRAGAAPGTGSPAEGRPPLRPRAGRAAVCPARHGDGAARPPEPRGPVAAGSLLGEAGGRSGGRPWALPAHRSLGIQGPQKSASESVYFQMTFFKKNSLPQMLDPESGMWSCKQLSPPRTLHSSLVAVGGLGGSWGALAIRGQSAEPGSGVCSWSRCVPCETLTPQARGSRTFAPAWQPRASAPTGLPACAHLGLQPAKPCRLSSGAL